MSTPHGFDGPRTNDTPSSDPNADTAAVAVGGSDAAGDHSAGTGTGAGAGATAADQTPGKGKKAKTMRQEVHAREKEEFGGMKFGAAFFGWLAATGLAVLLTALAIAIGAAVGYNTTGSTDEAADAAARNAETIALVAGITLLVVLFISYYAGGYVAGRMSRFSGAKQGIAVFIWGVVTAVVVAIVAALAGDQFDILANLGSVPRLPLGSGDVTTAGVITVLLALVASLGGAILGGLGGMRFHRKVDRAGLGR